MANIEEYLTKHGESLPRKATPPFASGCRPEVDVTTELYVKGATYDQSLIANLRWIFKLGRTNIAAELSMMASCMAMHRQGHLYQSYHVFGIFKNNHNSKMMFDPTEPDVGDAQSSR